MEELYKIYQNHPQVFIDTRKELSDAIFVAVGQKNEKGVHRGNQFAEMALESGKAAYAVINDPELKAKYANDERFILVEDGEKALQGLAHYHRQQLTIPVIVIAGSNGKTTTKELLDGVLSTKYKTFSTRGNYNNHLGVPLSILSIDASYEMAVLEIGANHLEETRFLAELILPDYGLLTNCGKDHLGEYGSIENVIQGNKELYDVLTETRKTAFVCKNDQQLVDISAEVNNRIFYGDGTTLDATVLATPFLKFELKIKEQSIDVQTNLFGRFWLDALLTAAAVGHHFGVSLEDYKKAVEAYQPAALRSQLTEWKGNKVLLDCYNANPSSMEVFVDEIQQSSMEASKVLVLGEMLELGVYSKAEHQTLVNRIDLTAYDEVIWIGESFLEVNITTADNQHYFPEKAAAEAYLQAQNYEGKYFFVKGSRGNRLETLFA